MLVSDGDPGAGSKDGSDQVPPDDPEPLGQSEHGEDEPPPVRRSAGPREDDGNVKAALREHRKGFPKKARNFLTSNGVARRTEANALLGESLLPRRSVPVVTT